MHKVLQLDEILRVIFNNFKPENQLDFDFYDDGDCNTLATLACVCKAFCSPALDILWYRIRGIKPIMCLFPQDCVAEGREMERPYLNESFFTRSLSALDWSRALLYCPRVRVLALGGYDPVCNSVFGDLPRMRRTAHIFPNLHTLLFRANEFDPRGLRHDFVSTLLNPSLKTLHITAYDFNRAELAGLSGILESLPVAAPCLQDLKLHIASEHPGIWRWESRDTFGSWVKNLQQLTNADIYIAENYPTSLLPVLATLPAIKALSINLPATQGNNQSLSSLSQTAFPALQELTLTSIPVQLFAQAVRKLKPSRELDVQIVSNTWSAHEFARSLDPFMASHFGKLESITISHNLLDDDFELGFPLDSSTHEVSSKDLRPLMSLHQLHTLKITTSLRFQFDDLDAHAMVAAWPSMKILELATDPEALCQYSDADHWNSRLTVTGLYRLITGFAYLERLGILFNSDPAPFTVSDDELLVVNPNFEVLDVGSTRCHSAVKVAALLSGIFPQDISIKFAFSSEEEADWDPWHEVSHILLPAFKKVRREEQQKWRDYFTQLEV